MAINRKIRYWKLPRTELQLGEKTLVMGVLNVTPDSFSDGGRYLDPDRAYARALEMEQQGADIIDIGAESTRPESKRISADEEWQRLVPVLKKLRDKLGIPLSIDTYKSEIATRAFEYGVEIVNDPSGLTLDPGLAKAAALADAGLILNHMRGTPETWGRLAPLPDVMANVMKELDATASRARRAGVDKARIVLDPGLGFGKRKEQNSELLAQLGRMVELDYPILVGPSKKAFLQLVADAEMGYATAAAVAVAIVNGADIVRVHDVLSMRAAVLVADEIVRMDAASARQLEAKAEKAAAAAKPAREFGRRDSGQSWLEPERKTSVRPPLAKVEPVVVAPSVAAATETPAASEDAREPVSATESQHTAEIKPGINEESEGATAETTETAAPSHPAPALPASQPLWKGGDRPVPRVTRAPPARQGQDRPLKRDSYGDRPVKRGGYGDRPAASGGDRPNREGGAPPRREWKDRPSRGNDGPARGDSRDRPQRSNYGDRPEAPRGRFGDKPAGDRPPRREGGAPPRREWTDRPPRRDSGDRPPPRSNYGDRPQGDRPQRSPGDRPPRKDFKGPPRRDSGGPPRRDFGGPAPRGGDGKGRGPRPGGSDRPPKREGGAPPSGSSDKRPPKKLFRKRP